MEFQFTEQYDRRAARFLKRHSDLRTPYLKTLQLLELNSHRPALRLHALGGKRTGLHSEPNNLFYRITLELLFAMARLCR